jgi:hypothetical protein
MGCKREEEVYRRKGTVDKCGCPDCPYKNLEECREEDISTRTTDEFLEIEQIRLITSTYSEEPEECVGCGSVINPDPCFSWYSCECCLSTLGGNRYHVITITDSDNIICFDVCEDCYIKLTG